MPQASFDKLRDEHADALGKYVKQLESTVSTWQDLRRRCKRGEMASPEFFSDADALAAIPAVLA
jgi:hypothetical protein